MEFDIKKDLKYGDILQAQNNENFKIRFESYKHLNDFEGTIIESNTEVKIGTHSIYWTLYLYKKINITNTLEIW